MRVNVALFECLDQVAASAGEALTTARQRHLFDRLSWFQHCVNHDASARPACVAHAQIDDAKGWLFLRNTGPSRLSALSNWYSQAYRPVFSSAETPSVQAALVETMAKRLLDQACQVDLGPVPEEDGSRAVLIKGFEQAGWRTIQRPQTGHWFTSLLPIQFEAYWRTRPSLLRNTYARKVKQAGLVCSVHHRLSEDLWADYVDVYEASWKPEEGSWGFLRALAQQTSDEGALRLGIARQNGVAVAAQMWTVDQHRALIHKLAYRKSLAHLSPGTILSAALFRHAIDNDQVNFISYGTGDDAYKADWVDQREQLWRLQFWNPTRAEGAAGYAYATARDWLRRTQRKLWP